VKVFAALLAKVLVGAGFFLHDAHTATVLPDLANVALDEQPSQVVAGKINVCQSRARLASIRWQSRVLLVSTDAAGDLVFLGHVVIELILDFGCVIFVVVLLACSASGQRWFDVRVERRLFGLF
jgi:hypothetical protein